MSVQVKICGVRRGVDAEFAIANGAQWIGIVGSEDSPRCVTIDEAREVRDVVADRAELVLVFRRPEFAEVMIGVAVTETRRVQIHGGDADLLDRLRAEGLRVHSVASVAADASALPRLDPAPTSDVPGLLDVGLGGTGTVFDWSLLAPGAPDATFLAGGITPDNVGRLLRYRPFGIDVSSGVETAPGIKDHAALERLLSTVHAHG